MTWLRAAPWPETPLPTNLPPVTEPQLLLDEAEVADMGEPLVLVEGTLPTFPVYARMPLRSRPADLLLRAAVLDRLVAADAALPDGWRLCLIDCWRSLEFQHELVSYYVAAVGKIDGYVSVPGGAVPPPHTTGGAVDLTLAYQGIPLALGTDFDAFTPDAAPAYLESVQLGREAQAARDARRLLAHVLGGQGFAVNPFEWWHWEHGTHFWARVTGVPTARYGAAVPGQ